MQTVNEGLTKAVDWCETDNVKNLFDRRQIEPFQNFELVVRRHQSLGIEDIIDHVDVSVARLQRLQYKSSVDGHSLMIYQSQHRIQFQTFLSVFDHFAGRMTKTKLSFISYLYRIKRNSSLFTIDVDSNWGLSLDSGE